LRLGEQHHRRDALTEKATDDVTDKATTQTLTLVLAKQVDLAQLTSITTPSLASALACPARRSDPEASATAEVVRGKQARIGKSAL